MRSGQQKSSDRRIGTPDSRRVVLWASISGLSFVFAIATVVGLRQSAFPAAVLYLALIAAGLSAAGFLFGALRSSARYQGRSNLGSLELGGPIIAALLIIILGFKYARPPDFIDLVIRASGVEGNHSSVLRDGLITIDLGHLRIPKHIDSDGEVHIGQVPATFVHQTISITAQSDGYESLSQRLTIPQNGILLIELRVKPLQSVISGRLLRSSERPVANARIYINGKLECETDEAGLFSSSLALKSGTIVRLRAEAGTDHKVGYEDYVPVKEGLMLLFGGAL